MKLLIHSLAVGVLALVFLSSCKSLENPVGKIQLDEQGLQEVVFQLEEYKNYVNAFLDMEEQQKTRANSLSLEDKQWLKSVHEKYPDSGTLFEEGAPEMIKRYNYLTGRDLHHENTPLVKRFSLLTEKLDQNYIYNKIDLADLLVPYTTK